MSVQFDFTQINQAIDRAVNAMTTLERSMVKTAKQSTIFNRAFGNQKQFDAFVDSINKLGVAGSANFKLVADGLTNIANAIAKIPAKTNIRTLVKDITALTTALSVFQGGGNSSLVLKTNILATMTVVQQLVGQLNTLQISGKPSKVLKEIANIFTAVGVITKNGATNAGSTTAAIKFLEDFVTQLLGLSVFAANSATSLKPIAKLMTEVREIIQGMNTLNSQGIDASRIPQFGTFVREFVKQVQLTQAGAAGVKDISNLSGSLLKIQKSLGDFFNNPIFAQAAQGNSLFYKAGAALGKTFSGGGGGLLGGLLTPFRAIKNFAGELLGINVTPSEKRFQQIQNFMNLFKTFSDALGGIASGVQNLQSLSKLSNAFSQIVSATKLMFKLSEDIPGGVFDRIKRKLGVGDVSNALRTISFLSHSLAGMAASIENLDSLGKLGNSLENLGIGVTKIINLSKILPNTLSANLKRILGLGAIPNTVRVIGSIAKQLSGISGTIGNVGELAKLGSMFEGVGKFVSAINKTNLGDIKGSKISRLPLIGKLFQQSKFKQVISIIKDVAGAFKGFKGVSVPNFAETLDSLIGFAADIGDAKFKNANLDGFQKFAEQLAKGLSVLSNAKLNVDKLNAVGNALKGIAGAGNNLPAAANVTSQTSSARGIIESAAGQFIGQVAFSVLNRLQNFLGKLLNFSTSIRGALSAIGQSLNSFGLAAQRAGQSLLNNFGLQNIINSPLTTVASDFDHLSNAVQTFGALTDEQLKHAQDFSDEIGIKYPLSANDALQATLDLIKAGQDLNSIEFILPNAADLASLGDTDLPTTTRALITATAAFDQYADGVASTFDNVAVAANAFSSAADVSQASVGELIEGLNNVAPAANLAGLDLQETLAVLVQFNDAGIRGAEAGTQLRQVLSTLRTDKATSELANLQNLLDKTGAQINLSLSNPDGSLRDYNDFIESLSVGYKRLGFNQTQLLDSIGELTGIRSQQGIAILLGDGGFQGIIDKMNAMEPASVRAAQLLDDFRGDVEQLRGSLETLQKNAFLPLIRNAFRPFVKAGRAVIDTLLTLPPAAFELASNIILVGSSLATVAGGLLIAVASLAKFEAVAFRAGSALIAFVTNLPLIIAGLPVAIASLAALAGAAVVVGSAIAGAALVVSGFRDVIERDIGNAGGAFDQLRTAVTYAASRVAPALRSVGRVLDLIFGRQVQGEVADFGSRVAEFFTRLTIGSVRVGDLITEIGSIVEVFGEFVEVSFGKSNVQYVEFFEDQLRKLSTFPLIKAIFGNNANPQGIKKVFGQIKNLITGVAHSIDDIFSGSIGVLFGEPEAVQRVKKGFGTLLSTILTLIRDVTGLNLGEAILDFDQGKLGKGVESFFRTVLGEVRNWFVSHRDDIITAVGDVLTFAGRATFGAASFILNVLGLGAAADTVQNIGDTIADVIRRGTELAIRLFAGETIIDASGIQNFIDSFLGDPTVFIRQIADTVSNLITTALGEVPALIGDIGKRLSIQPLIDFGITLQNSDLFQHFVDGIGYLAGLSLDLVADAFNGIKAAIDAANKGDFAGPTALILAIGGLAANAGILTALFSGLRTFLFGIAIPALGIDLLARGLGNLNALLQTGDLGTFLKDTLSEVASDVAGIFGFSLPADTIFDQAVTNLSYILSTLPPLIGTLGDQILLSLEEFRANIDQGLKGIGASSGFGDAFDTLRSQLKNADFGSGETIFGQIVDASKLVDPAALQAIADESAQNIINAFIGSFDKYGSVDAVPDALFRTIIEGLNRTGLLDEALDSVDTQEARDKILERMTSLGAGSSEVLDENVGELISNIQTALINGITQGVPGGNSQENIRGYFIQLLTEGGASDLTPEQQDFILNQIITNLQSMPLKTVGDKAVIGLLQAISQSFKDAPPQPTVIQYDVTLEANSVDVSPLRAAIQSAILTTVTGGNGLTDTPVRRGNPERRAQGGPVAPYSAYQVHDTVSPELLRLKDGTSLLLTGAMGGSIVRIPSYANAPVEEIDEQGFTTSDRDIQASRDEVKKQRKQEKNDTQKQIDDLTDDIIKAEVDYFEQRYDRIKEANKTAKRAEEDYEHNRLETIRTGRESLLDAIRRGDGAAALATSKQTKEKLTEDKYQFDLDKKRRDEDLKDQLDEYAREKQERDAEFAKRMEELKNHNSDLDTQQSADDQAELDQLAAANRRLADQQALADANIIANAADTQTQVDYFSGVLKNRTIDAFGNIFTTVTDGIKNLGDANDFIRSKLNETTDLINNIKANGQTISDAITGILGSGSGNGTIGNPQQPGGGSGGSSGGGGIPGSPGSSGGSGNPGGLPSDLPKSASEGTLWYSAIAGAWYQWKGGRWLKTAKYASGGSFDRHSAINVFDAVRPELLTLNDGTSMLLSGKNSGRVIPMSANTGPVHRGSNIPSHVPPPSRAPTYQNGSGSGQRPIIFNLNGDIISNASDPREVAKEVYDVVMPELRETVEKASASKRSKTML